MIFYERPSLTLHQGHALDVLREMPSESVHCCITSPPYWGLRDYKIEPQIWPDGWRGSLGLEPTIDLFMAHLMEVMGQCKRVLRRDGVMFCNLGDSYFGGKGSNGNSKARRTASERGYQQSEGTVDMDTRPLDLPQPGLKPKDLCLIPFRFALACQEQGWYVRSVIIWAKKSPMPESVTDRPTTAHEYIFQLTRSEKYFYDAEAVREKAEYGRREQPVDTWDRCSAIGQRVPGTTKGADPSAGRNLRTVWELGPEPFSGWTKVSRLSPVALGDVCGGMKHKVSPDCPVHGYQGLPCGGREDETYSRKGCNDGRLDQELEPVRDYDSTLPALSMLESSSDLLGQQCAPSAIVRSNESHKMGRALETSQPCMPFAEIACRTADIPEGPEMVDSVGRTCENSNGPDVQDAHSQGQTLYRTVDKSSLPIPPSCICSFYQESTENTSHFATFPSEVPRRCIKAGTPEAGCCSQCGKPWERTIVKTRIRVVSNKGSNFDAGKTGINGLGRVQEGGRFEKVALGFRAACGCGAPSQPATVLDPFGGSGTVGIVANELGRRAILIELNPDYCAMARERLRQEVLL